MGGEGMKKVYWLFETVFQSISRHLPDRDDR